MVISVVVGGSCGLLLALLSVGGILVAAVACVCRGARRACLGVLLLLCVHAAPHA